MVVGTGRASAAGRTIHVIGRPVLVWQIVANSEIGVAGSFFEKLGEVRGDQATEGVVPGPRTDAIFGVDGAVPAATGRGAEEGAPRLRTGSGHADFGCFCA